MQNPGSDAGVFVWADDVNARNTADVALATLR